MLPDDGDERPTQLAKEIFNAGVTLPDGTHADGWDESKAK